VNETTGNTGFIVDLDVDETFLDSGITLAYAIVSWKKVISPSHVLPNPIFGVISTTE